jgi:hypothetical protein
VPRRRSDASAALAIVAALSPANSRLAPGSFLATSHLVASDPQLRERLTDLMLSAAKGSWGRVRTTAEVDQFFTGLEIIPPGLVEITTWRPDGTAAVEQTFDWIEYGGVARKPAREPRIE